MYVLQKVSFHLVEGARIKCKCAKKGRKYGDSFFDLR